MATAQQIINRALTSLGVLAAGETPTSEESSNALVSLNDMLQDWSNQALLVHGETQISFTPAGAATFTIGASGDINTSRPTEILRVFYRLNDIDYPIKIYNLDDYDAIEDKTTTSDIPEIVYFRMAYPLITAYVYPIVTGGTLYIECLKPITEFTALSTSASFPVGYERALRLNLAVELMPEYGIENATLMMMAAEAKANLKRVNTKPITLGISVPPARRYNSSILSG